MARYDNQRERRTEDGRRYLPTTRFPKIPLNENDIYVYAQRGDRFDLLAYSYYNDRNLWWVISRANSHIKHNSIFLPEGEQIRIPANIEEILLQYEELNS